MNQGSIRIILLSIKMITTSYRFISLKHSKSQKSFFKYTGNCCFISHALTSLLQNLKRHYHIQRSFPHLPIRGQTNPVHISHSIYIILTFKKSSDVSTAYQYVCLISRNDHANGTKATKYIQHYGYKKSSLKSETTQNET